MEIIEPHQIFDVKEIGYHPKLYVSIHTVDIYFVRYLDRLESDNNRVWIFILQDSIELIF